VTIRRGYIDYDGDGENMFVT